MKTFQSHPFKNKVHLRGLVIRRQPWFVLGDILKCIGSSPRYAVDLGGKDSVRMTDRRGDEWEMVSSALAMRIVDAIGTDTAADFRVWLTHEVIPSLMAHYNTHAREVQGTVFFGDFVSSDVENGNFSVTHSDPFGAHRTIMLEGQVWYVASNICRVAKINRPRPTLEKFCPNRKVYSFPFGGKILCEYIINGDDLQNLLENAGSFPQKGAMLDWLLTEAAENTKIDYSYVPPVLEAEIVTEETSVEVMLPVVVEQPKPAKAENGFVVFEHSEFGSIRITDREGNPWFVGVDIAKALGYENPTRAVNMHSKKSIKSTINPKRIDGKKRPPVNINLIPESDVYRLIFSSKLETAEKFQDWVFEEVLPSIRKTGSYSLLGEQPAIDPRLDLLMGMINELKAQGDRNEEMIRAIGAGRYEDRMDSDNYLSVVEIPWMRDVFEDTGAARAAVVRKLRTLSSEYEVPYVVRNWGDKKALMTEKSAFDKKVVGKLYSLLKKDSTVLKKWRRTSCRFRSKYVPKSDLVKPIPGSAHYESVDFNF